GSVAGPAMSTKAEKYRSLCDFLEESFRPSELEMFLELNGFVEVAAAVNRSVGRAEYVFEVVQALDRRGLIDAEFFGRLTTERPAKKAQVQKLGDFWLEQDQRSVEPSGSTTPSGPGKVVPTKPERQSPAPSGRKPSRRSKEESAPGVRPSLLGKKRVFISYSHDDPDQALARDLKDGLVRADHQVFIDTEIKVGADWGTTILEWLAAADFFVLLLSARSVHSEMVREEARVAHER